jgi:3-hydroxyacyl-CoA dehydrogenase
MQNDGESMTEDRTSPRGVAASRPVARAAVIGAGVMGGGIAMCFANAGLPVVLIDVSQEGLDRGMARLRGVYETSVARGSLEPAQMQARLALIEGAVGIEAARDADVVIEAVFEDMEVKTDIFRALDRVVRPGAILATNTSYLDVDAIAAATSRPQDVIGLHFFSPANVMRLVEVVRAGKTAPDALATGVALARRLGKLPVVVGVCFGFAANRMLAQRSLAADRLLLSGATPRQVDEAITRFGFRMGHFAMLDMAGLEIGFRARKITGYQAPVADALAAQGHYGQKTGRGFYRYAPGARQGQDDPETLALVLAMAREQGLAPRAFDDAEILARLFYPVINEGAKILDEGVAESGADVDLVWLNGFGWPATTGGPMAWADSVGLPAIVTALERQAREHADRSLAPAALLRRLADGGGSLAAYGGASEA